MRARYISRARIARPVREKGRTGQISKVGNWTSSLSPSNQANKKGYSEATGQLQFLRRALALKCSKKKEKNYGPAVKTFFLVRNGQNQACTKVRRRYKPARNRARANKRRRAVIARIK